MFGNRTRHSKDRLGSGIPPLTYSESGSYIVLGFPYPRESSLQSSMGTTSNRTYFWRALIPAGTYDALSFATTGSGATGNAQFGIYNTDSNGLYSASTRAMNQAITMTVNGRIIQLLSSPFVASTDRLVWCAWSTPSTGTTYNIYGHVQLDNLNYVGVNGISDGSGASPTGKVGYSFFMHTVGYPAGYGLDSVSNFGNRTGLGAGSSNCPNVALRRV